MQKNKIHDSRTLPAFTIIELIIVIVVISIISAVTIVSYNTVTNQAREKAALVELNNSYDLISLWKLEHAGVAPSSLDAAGIAQPDNTTLAYYTYGNGLKYCISARADETTAFYRLSDVSAAPTEGSCDEPDWIAGAPLAFNNTPGTNKPLSTPISGTPDITLYTVFSIVDASQAWSSFGGLTPGYDYNRFYFQGSSAGSTTSGYRIDTPAQLNATGNQGSVRTPGYHIGWMQTTSSGTSRSFAYDEIAPYATATLSVHAGWSFTDLYTPGVGSTYSGIATVVYDAGHDELTRQNIMNWLAKQFNTGQTF